MTRFGDAIKHQGPSHTCGYRMSKEAYDAIAAEQEDNGRKSKIPPHAARHRHDAKVLAHLNQPANQRVKQITSLILY